MRECSKINGSLVRAIGPEVRCQLPPPVKNRSGIQTFPALSVRGGPLYPARRRMGADSASEESGGLRRFDV